MPVRYAPSPTGTLHVGNLRTAWISHHLARERQRPWLVRFEDIDGPRVVPGAIERQLEDLAALGMIPDQLVIQSQNQERHRSLFEKAVTEGAVYPCTCSRQEIRNELDRMASAPHGAVPVYHGNCREPSRREKARHSTIAWRFRHPKDSSGHQDFIIGRTHPDHSDFFPAYHWACAIDDHDAACSLLVRASDLAHAAEIQSLVHAWVASVSGNSRDYPQVFLTSLVVSDNGHRLEKRTRGVTLQELLSSGWTTERILKAFENSWKGELEENAALRLSDLGIVTSEG